jgi:Arc/MetJ-type ribon-helix-helix transcriptional regulator
MSELPVNKTDQIRAGLQQLLKESGRKEHLLATQVEEVLAENERLKQEVARLRRTASPQGSSTMSSKLRDALRE